MGEVVITAGGNSISIRGERRVSEKPDELRQKEVWKKNVRHLKANKIASPRSRENLVGTPELRGPGRARCVENFLFSRGGLPEGGISYTVGGRGELLVPRGKETAAWGRKVRQWGPALAGKGQVVRPER